MIKLKNAASFKSEMESVIKTEAWLKMVGETTFCFYPYEGLERTEDLVEDLEENDFFVLTTNGEIYTLGMYGDGIYVLDAMTFEVEQGVMDYFLTYGPNGVIINRDYNLIGCSPSHQAIIDRLDSPIMRGILETQYDENGVTSKFYFDLTLRQSSIHGSLQTTMEWTEKGWLVSFYSLDGNEKEFLFDRHLLNEDDAEEFREERDSCTKKEKAIMEKVKELGSRFCEVTVEADSEIHDTHISVTKAGDLKNLHIYFYYLNASSCFVHVIERCGTTNFSSENKSVEVLGTEFEVASFIRKKITAFARMERFGSRLQ